ncbi:hypothetical protein PCANC_10473 [Puccinia coronata f. sp. avenae]|uniref:Transcription initiation factor TFIID subunit 13 n=1 Tax=Puccinia coronata f. sp. avenae TaxID=200324 RepID=A0A2N5T476_9BASI|nr:hypothetical protein PCASD_19737 [Puccinia coronata f. sp. avenae]PLW49726.1 hypothetical protein PCANC_10473 [Puccinia coronata f. sp. avenae]
MAHQHSFSGPSSHVDHATQVRSRPRISKKGLFAKDLSSMMFGFGDTDPQRDVVNLMEEIVIDHISDVLITAHKRSTNRGKLKVDDIKSALEESTTRVHNPPGPQGPTTTTTSTTSTTGREKIPYAPYPLARRKVSLAEKQLSRIEELLFMQDDLARARGRADDLKAYGRDDYSPDDHQMDNFHQQDKGKQREL